MPKKPPPALTIDMLKRLPPDRDVISLHLGADVRGHMAVVKFALQSGATDVLGLPGPLVEILAGSLAQAERAQGWSLNSSPDTTFLARQPELVQDDWSPEHVALRVELHHAPTWCIIGALIDRPRQIYKALRLDIPSAIHLQRYLAGALADGEIRFRADGPPPGSKPS